MVETCVEGLTEWRLLALQGLAVLVHHYVGRVGKGEFGCEAHHSRF